MYELRVAFMVVLVLFPDFVGVVGFVVVVGGGNFVVVVYDAEKIRVVYYFKFKLQSRTRFV